MDAAAAGGRGGLCYGCRMGCVFITGNGCCQAAGSRGGLCYGCRQEQAVGSRGWRCDGFKGGPCYGCRQAVGVGCFLVAGVGCVQPVVAARQQAVGGSGGLCYGCRGGKATPGVAVCHTMAYLQVAATYDTVGRTHNTQWLQRCMVDRKPGFQWG